MNAHNLARTAYSSSTAPTRTPRSTEYEAFAKVTHRLKSALAPNGNFTALVSALYENNRLWTILAADVSGDENRLPADLRAGIFYLHEFTQHHTRQILQNKESADVLIDINAAIMRGLRSTEGVS